LISLGLGGLITASIQFAFEHTIPDWRRRKAAKSAFHRYAYPLILSAFLLFREIHKIEHHAKEFEEFKKNMILILKKIIIVLVNCIHLAVSLDDIGFRDESFVELSEQQ